MIKTAIVTGGTGPIGLALVRKLLSQNVEVTVLLRQFSAKEMYLPEHPLLHKEYCSLDELEKYNTEKRYDFFFHLGWKSSNASCRNDMKVQIQNIQYTISAVELASRLGCNTFLGVGSQAEYGICSEKLTEETLCIPEHGYGMAKLCAGQMSKVLCAEKNMRHLWVRILSVYGPYDNLNSLLISTILKLDRGETPQLTKGDQIWDFLYVDDAAEAIYRVALYGKAGNTYVVGSDEVRSIRDSVEIIVRKMNSEVKPQYGAIPYSYNQKMYMVADNTKIKNDTGWAPKISFDDGITRTINFYRNWNTQLKDQFLQSLKKEINVYNEEYLMSVIEFLGEMNDE